MHNSDTPALHRATMRPSGKQFEILPGHSLLESGVSAGIALPFGCANGSCGECRARICTGSITKIKPHDFTLTDAQKLDGQCLLCSFTADTDVEIEVYEAQTVNDIPFQQLQAKPYRHETTPLVDLVTLKFVRGKALRFLPGQCVSFWFADGTATRLPIASCPCDAQTVEFHLFKAPYAVPAVAAISSKVLETIATQKYMAITGPTGNFTLSADVQKPKLFFAVGGDFAHLQGMIEQVLNTDLGVPCTLVWQASAEISQYRSNLCRSWHDAIDEFSYVSLDAGSLPMSLLEQQLPAPLQVSEVYLGGAYRNVKAELIQRGVDPASILYPDGANQFVSSAEFNEG